MSRAVLSGAPARVIREELRQADGETFYYGLSSPPPPGCSLAGPGALETVCFRRPAGEVSKRRLFAYLCQVSEKDPLRVPSISMKNMTYISPEYSNAANCHYFELNIIGP